MGKVADSIAVKILIGVATAAVWFVLSRAANADERPIGLERACWLQVWTITP
jgi:hypothetical protein